MPGNDARPSADNASDEVLRKSLREVMMKVLPSMQWVKVAQADA